MESDFLIVLLMRWVHIVTAVLLAGALPFYGYVFWPIAHQVLTKEEREKLHVPLFRRWKLYVHPAIILFLVSGFYNYFAVTRFLHEGQPLYHALFGTKLMLALVVFGLLIILMSTQDWAIRLRKRRGPWTLLVLLTAAVILLGGYMKVMPTSGVGAVPVVSDEMPVPEWPGRL